MELTIEQALQRGVAAHREGKLQDAELPYIELSCSLSRDILTLTHNLGVLAVFFNRARFGFAII